MVNGKERCVTDDQGNRVAALLEVDGYRRLLDALKELGSIHTYDAAVADSRGRNVRLRQKAGPLEMGQRPGINPVGLDPSLGDDLLRVRRFHR
jgi:hypothetical protein